jgi:hypothetical protein
MVSCLKSPHFINVINRYSKFCKTVSAVYTVIISPYIHYSVVQSTTRVEMSNL